MRYRKSLSTGLAIMFLTMLLMACGGGNSSPASQESVITTRSVAGSITPPGYAAVDSDVNDPQAPYAANDTFDQAQAIKFPVILAGYANLAGKGAPGRSFITGDPKDFYRLGLSEGDPIILFVPSPNDTDLDLFLFRASDFALVDSSMGNGEYETLAAPADGEYIIEVRVIDGGRATAGASIYNLIIGGEVIVTDPNHIRLSHDFVPGEVVVRLADETAAHHLGTLTVDNLSTMGMTHVGGDNGREMLYSFAAGEQTRSVMTALDLEPPSRAGVSTASISEPLQHKLDTLRVIKAVSQRPDVQMAAPNLIHQPFIWPDDENIGLQWHYDQIHLPEAWDITTGNDEVVVAVIDTGVLVNHPDLKGRLTADGYDFIRDTTTEGDEPANERGGIDSNPDDPGDENAGGSSFHGTHVAGTIAADTNNARGVAGVAWNAARIMPLRALGVGGGTSYDVLQAVRYAAGLPNDSGTFPTRPADIINLSLGSDAGSVVEQDVFNTISANGVIVVAAAGNKAGNEQSFPAAYGGVFSVSAVNYSSALAYYSNFGATVDVAAPGGDNTIDLNADGYPDGVLSTKGDDTSGTIIMNYAFAQGTSMAAPHVSGVAALMKSVWPEMGASEFDGLLSSGAITNDLGDPGRDDRYGYGLIDAQKAVLTAQGGTAPTLLRVSPSALGFGEILNVSTLRVEKLGDVSAVLTVDQVSDDADWMDVVPAQIDGDGLGTYTVTVSRTALADGIYNGTISFVSAANTVEVPVSMQVNPTDQNADAGYHYVLLLDPTTYENRGQVEATLDNGVYHYSFTGVAEGEYLLYAGTDLDNNFIVGNAGEAKGSYLSLDQPILVRVNRDLTGLDFRTEFNINLSDFQPLNSSSREVPIRRIQKKRLSD